MQRGGIRLGGSLVGRKEMCENELRVGSVIIADTCDGTSQDVLSSLESGDAIRY